jgi:NADH:ubiquinone oxidoreductase subunit 4 (subunit M)
LKALAALSSVNHMSFLLLLLLIQGGIFKWGAVFIILAHGFVSPLLFFFIGEVYHVRLTRVFYFLGGLFFSNFVFLFFFFFIWLLNRGIPPSLSFFSELMGVVCVFFCSRVFFFFLFFYFFCSFYYSLYVLVSGSVGKGRIFFFIFHIFIRGFFFFCSINFFLFNFLLYYCFIFLWKVVLFI